MEEVQGSGMLESVCLGNTEAARFIDLITTILHFWDDLIDKDKLPLDAEINRIMWSALVDLPRNPFYASNFVSLNAILMSAIVNWEIATQMERIPEEGDLSIAFIIRSSYVDLLTETAILIGGREHAVRTMLPIRRYIHDEGFWGFVQALKDEKSARERNCRGL